MPTWGWWAAGAVVAVWTALAFAAWPFANCRRCDGKGRWQVTDQPDWRRRLSRHTYCSVCRGTGRRFAPFDR